MFTFGNYTVEITDNYASLGCLFNYNEKFNKAIHERVAKG